MNVFSGNPQFHTPKAIKNILIITGLVFFATMALQGRGVDLYNYLSLYFIIGDKFIPTQLVTYMFMHGNFQHIFFNMFAVWMFGRVLEQVWGTRRFLVYYFITGIGAAFVHMGVYYYEHFELISKLHAFMLAQDLNSMSSLLSAIERGGPGWITGANGLKELTVLWENDPLDLTVKAKIIEQVGLYQSMVFNGVPTVGASGAVFGILLAYGMLFPNSVIMLLIPPIPIKAKYFVIIYGVVELYAGVSRVPGDNVAHFAHLGGMIFGYFLIKYWRKKGVSNTGPFF